MLSERVDQWAFGVLLWEMLTGQQPWADLDHPMQARGEESCGTTTPALR